MGEDGLSNKFKVGDEVVIVEQLLPGRPRARKIDRVWPPNAEGVVCYSGEWWKASEDSLVLASEYAWPSELEMRVMDGRAREQNQRDFEQMMRHHEED